MDLVHHGTTFPRLFLDKRSYQTLSTCGMLLLERRHDYNVPDLFLIGKIKKGGKKGSSKDQKRKEKLRSSN